MSIIFFLIACSVVLAICFLAAFFWSHNSGQNKDLYTPAIRILFDDELVEEKPATRKEVEERD